MRRRFLYLICLLPAMLGAGPCDMPESEEMTQSPADGGDVCEPQTCMDQVTVDVVRADNQAFEDGTYGFAGLYPNGAYVESICFYDTLTQYLECENSGMMAVMAAQGRKVILTFQGAPERLRVGVAYNQISVGDVEIEPLYDNIDTAEVVEDPSNGK